MLLLLTALIRNFYKFIIGRLDTKALDFIPSFLVSAIEACSIAFVLAITLGLKKSSRIKAFVFKFISVPAK